MSELETRPEQESNPVVTQPELPGAPALAAPAARAPAATFIFLTVTLDMLALGMIAPVLPRLVEGFVHGNASSAARVIGLFGTLFAAMQFVFSPILGSLSDRFGRRPIVLLSNFGMGIDYLVMAWAPALPWLYLGRVISGLTASSIPTAMAYMADVTPPEKRAGAFGMMNAAFGLGFVLGPALGGILGQVNPRLPFLVAACLSLLNGMYGLFVLPESLTLANRAPFSWRRANPVGSLSMLARTGTLMRLSAVLLTGYLAQQVLMNVYVIYADYRYHWSARSVGLSLGLVGVFTIVYGAFLVRPAIAQLGERRAILMGLTGGAIGYVCCGYSRTGLLLLLGIPILNLMQITWPSVQGLMTRTAAANEQGQLQGAINGIRMIAGVAGPTAFTWIFARAIAPGNASHLALLHSPGLPFYAAAALLVIAMPLSVSATGAPLAATREAT